MSEHLFCARASSFDMTTKSATVESEYYGSRIYHALYPCWVITTLNAVVVKAHGGCWCPNIYFVPGHQHSAWQPNPRHLKPNIIVIIYTMRYIPVEHDNQSRDIRIQILLFPYIPYVTLLAKKVVTPPLKTMKPMWFELLCFHLAEIGMIWTRDCSPTKSDTTLGRHSMQGQVGSSSSETTV